MKVFALSCVMIMGSTVMAASEVRVDVYGNKAVGLRGVRTEGGMKIIDPDWIKEEEKPFFLIAISEVPAIPEWTEYHFSFKPESSGMIQVKFRVQWARDEKKRKWIAIREIRLNDESYTYDDFVHTGNDNNNKKKKKAKNKKGTQLQFSQDKTPSQIEMDDGVVVLVNHDHLLQATLEVKSGKTYTITVMAKDISG